MARAVLLTVGSEARVRLIKFLILSMPLSLTACAISVDGVGNSIATAIGKGLGCVINGGFATSEEHLTVKIDPAWFESARARLAKIPEKPTAAHFNVFPRAEMAELEDRLLYAEYNVEGTKADRLLTFPQFEDILFRALVHVAKSTERNDLWTFKRVTMAADNTVDSKQTVVRLSLKFTAEPYGPAAETAAVSKTAEDHAASIKQIMESKTIMFCD